MNFPEKLQKLRKERGWSQEELATRITVSRQAVSKWELGTAVPDTDNIVQLSELFGVTTDYLIKDKLDCDEDIPAVARTAANVRKAEQSRQLLIAGIVTLVLGVIIIGVLLTLSQVVESYQKVTYDHGPMMEMLPDGTTQISDEHRMATTRVRYTLSFRSSTPTICIGCSLLAWGLSRQASSALQNTDEK